jgi:xylulokinase
METILGIDIGTTGCKIGLFDINGNLIKQCYRGYRLISEENGYVEEDPEEWWEKTVEGINEIMYDSNLNIEKNSIIGIGISCTNAVVCVDKEGQPLLNAIMQLDKRSFKEVKFIKNIVGEENIFNITGNRVFEGSYSAPVILWIKKNLPDLYKKIYKVLSPAGYLVYKLTNKFTMDTTRGSTTMLMDILKREWSDELCNEVKIETGILPEIFFPEQIVGYVSNKAAKITGLKEGIPVIAGCMDTVSAGLGLGVKDIFDAFLIIGTVGRICYPIDVPKFDDRFMNVCFTKDIPWLIIAPVNAAGLSMRWFKENFCVSELEVSKNLRMNVYSLLDKEAKLVPLGSNGLVYFPYLAGERSPIWRTDIKGAFLGITINSRKEDFIRAIMEGVAFALKSNIEIMESILDYECSKIFAGGGGMLSSIWAEIFSNVLCKKLVVPSIVESEMLGSAIFASVGVGYYENLKSAVKHMVKFRGEIVPENEKCRQYAKIYGFYREAFQKGNIIKTH